jgi:type I restriction enzyme S subunit
MASEWDAATVGDIFDLVNGYAFKSADFISSGVPVIKIKNVKAGKFVEHEFSYVSEDFLRARVDKLAKFGDLLISMSGNRHDGSPETWVGKVAQFHKAGSYFINQRVGALRVKPGVKVDSRFASYVLSSFPYQELFIAIATSSGGQANLSPAQILSAPIRYPSLEEQRIIAHILGTLDDKIELNRKQNETLEAMARALFKAWFVDFEPVRAKMEGRWQRGQSLPGLPAHLYDLFPDRLVESELGEIPEGWEVTAIDGEFDVTMGQSPPGSTYNETGEGIPFYQGRADFEFRFPKRRVYCIAPTRFAKRWDTLVSVRAPVGDINMASEDCAIGRGVAAVRHKIGCRSYTYQFMNSISDVFAQFNSEGTVFGSIGKKDFHAIAHVKPSRDLVLAYERLAAPLDDQNERNERESRYLDQLRDTLLPKLISGELRVSSISQDALP